MNNGVRNIVGFVDKEECELILKKCLDELELNTAKTYSENMTDNLNRKQTRKSKVGFITDLGELNDIILSKVMEDVKIKGYCPSINDFQFAKYDKGDYFDWHTDSNNTTLKDRFYTIVLQLNDTYCGGDFELMVNNKEIKMDFGVGNLFIFPSNVVHRVKSIESGIRYSLVSWLVLKPLEGHKKTLL